MHKIPLNHKTIFVLDHSGHFALSSEQPIEFDAPVKPKAATSTAAAPPPTQKLNPLTKCLWSCNIEALLEFSRIVYDLHPQDKLIRLMVTKFDIPLNSWLPNEQGLEHISMLMGSVPAPTVQLKPSYEGEDMVNLCKALNIAVGLIAQTSPMQISLAQQQQAKAAANSISGTPTKSNAEIVPNTGRIVLFTSSRARDLDQIQEFMEKAIEKCNKDIEAAFRNEQLTDSLSLLKINLIELVLIDIVNCKQNLTFEKDIFKQNSSELRTHILSSKSGNHLSYKMIELTQKFYDLAITSVTNIPMKEELNASSSANYDVDILHSKALHDQLKICGLYKSCLLKKDAPNTVCLKWSNPKTNITEFNFSNNSFRITPIDVNSRPASCLTSFLLGGRCVLLEVPQGRVFPAANTNRVQSHVLYNQGNEIFMHGLNFSVKSHLDDKLERFSIDDSAERIKDFRINEFVDLMRAHKLTQTPNENESFNAQKALHRLEKATRKWPIKYSSTLITNLIQLKPLVKSVTEESINDIQYNECIKCIEYYQSGEHKNEPITSANLLAAPSAEQLALLGKPRKDVYKRIWLELESMLKYYQDVSERHRILYSHVRNMLISTLRNESLIKARASGVTTNPANVHAAASQAKNDEIANQIENEKLGRKRKINKDLISASEEINLLDMWLRSQNEAHKSRLEFYGRVAYPNQIAQLYTHLKLDELPASKLTGAKIDM